MRNLDYLQYTTEDFALDESFRLYYLSANQEDILFWKAWIEEHPEKQHEINEALELLSVLISRLPSEEFEAQVDQFAAEVLSDEKPASISPPHRWLTSWMRVAAVIALLVAVGIGSYRLLQKPAPSTTQAKAVRWVTKAAHRGQKLTIALPDGSSVHLNSESQLSYPENFGDSSRVVRFSGEAFFEVTKDPQRPFVVQADEIFTKVLGTSFSINAYPENRDINVVLVEGKVQVGDSASEASMVLQPQEMASFHKAERNLTKSEVNTWKYTAWKDGVILFDNAPFAEIERVLERWYNVEFAYQNEPAMQGFTGEFKNQSLEAVMNGIGFSVGFSYEIQGETVTITPK